MKKDKVPKVFVELDMKKMRARVYEMRCIKKKSIGLLKSAVLSLL